MPWASRHGGTRGGTWAPHGMSWPASARTCWGARGWTLALRPTNVRGHRDADAVRTVEHRYGAAAVLDVQRGAPPRRLVAPLTPELPAGALVQGHDKILPFVVPEDHHRVAVERGGAAFAEAVPRPLIAKVNLAAGLSFTLRSSAFRSTRRAAWRGGPRRWRVDRATRAIDARSPLKRSGPGSPGSPRPPQPRSRTRAIENPRSLLPKVITHTVTANRAQSSSRREVRSPHPSQRRKLFLLPSRQKPRATPARSPA